MLVDAVQVLYTPVPVSYASSSFSRYSWGTCDIVHEITGVAGIPTGDLEAARV